MNDLNTYTHLYTFVTGTHSLNHPPISSVFPPTNVDGVLHTAKENLTTDIFLLENR
jgi:hypothetical protein